MQQPPASTHIKHRLLYRNGNFSAIVFGKFNKMFTFYPMFSNDIFRFFGFFAPNNGTIRKKGTVFRNMKESWIRFSFTFFVGAFLYPMIELAYRGKTHVLMSLLGGLCALVIDWVDRTLGKRRFVKKAFLSAILITQLEFISGVLFNLKWNLGIWDYSLLPYNLAGQICLQFSFFWFLLSLFGIFCLRAMQFALTPLIKKPKVRFST